MPRQSAQAPAGEAPGSDAPDTARALEDAQAAEQRARLAVAARQHDAARATAAREGVEAELARIAGLAEVRAADLLARENAQRQHARLEAAEAAALEAVTLAEGEVQAAEAAVETAREADARSRLRADAERLYRRAEELDAELEALVVAHGALSDEAERSSPWARDGEDDRRTALQVFASAHGAERSRRRVPTPEELEERRAHVEAAAAQWRSWQFTPIPVERPGEQGVRIVRPGPVPAVPSDGYDAATWEPGRRA